MSIKCTRKPITDIHLMLEQDIIIRMLTTYKVLQIVLFEDEDGEIGGIVLC